MGLDKQLKNMELSFLMKLQSDVDFMLIRCKTRDQRVKWMEGIRALISLSGTEQPIGEDLNPVKNYASLLLSNTKAAIKLTAKFRGLVKNIDNNPNSTLAIQNMTIGKLALVSISIIIQLASAPFQCKTSHSEFVSCLNSWLKSMTTVIASTGDLPQLKSVYTKIEELLNIIISASRPTLSLELSYYLQSILDIIKDLHHGVPGTANCTIGVARFYFEQFSKLLTNIQKNVPPAKMKSLQTMSTALGDSIDNLYMSYMEYNEGKNKTALVQVQNLQQKILQQIQTFTNELEVILGTPKILNTPTK